MHILHFVSSLRSGKMYERHRRRYSLCDISKVDRTVDVVLLKVRAPCLGILKLSRRLPPLRSRGCILAFPDREKSREICTLGRAWW